MSTIVLVVLVVLLLANTVLSSIILYKQKSKEKYMFGLEEPASVGDFINQQYYDAVSEDAKHGLDKFQWHKDDFFRLLPEQLPRSRMLD
jgi:hypothetical protein